MAESYNTQDRVQAMAVIVSMVTGQTYYIQGLTDFFIRKTDDGEAGTWNFSAISTPTDVLFDRPDQAADYVKVASPMDLVAIYARRNVVAGTDRERLADRIGPAPGAYVYGGDGGTTVALLGQPAQSPRQTYDATGDFLSYDYGPFDPDANRPTAVSRGCCLMVGMVDGVREQVDARGRFVGFTAVGKDLTKVFYVNDTMVPPSQEASALQTGGNAMPLLTYSLYLDTDATRLLVDMANILVGKKFTKQQAKALNIPANAQAISEFAEYGYPWGDFISLNRLTPGFRVFKTKTGGNKYLPFQLQSGSAWANIQEIANPPVNRLFVDEWGQIVFDDALGAWQSAPPKTISADQIYGFQAGFDDSNVVTFLSTYPKIVLNGLGALAKAYGQAQNFGFVNGLAETGRVSYGHVQKYGYRYGEFPSMYDLDAAATAKRREVVKWMHNNFWTAQAVVKGGPWYRCGDRYLFDIETSRLETSKNVWYVRGYEHHFQQGDDWYMQLDLAYPDIGTANGKENVP